MAKCVVLGADGFIGCHLTIALSEAGHEVLAFDRFKNNQAINLPKDLAGVTRMQGNFLNRHDLEQAVEGMDYVFHFVSTTNPATSGHDPLLDVETNIRMSVELMQACVESKVKRIIFPSTGGAIYGRDQAKPFTEEDMPEPLSPYAIGKLAIEGYLRFFKHAHNLDYLALRVSNPYGERQNVTGSQGVIPIFLNLIRQDLPLTVYGDNSSVRDYIYIKDIIAMIVEMFDKPTQYNLYNLGSGEGTELGKLIEILTKVSGKDVQVTYEPARPTDIHQILLDTSRFEAEFSTRSTTKLEEGIIKTWEYVKTQGEK